MPLGALDILVDVALPASEASTQAAVDSVRTFVNGLESSLGTVTTNLSVAATRSNAVRGALLSLLTEAQALLPALFERLKPMADTAPFMAALDEAITAVEAS